MVNVDRQTAQSLHEAGVCSLVVRGWTLVRFRPSSGAQIKAGEEKNHGPRKPEEFIEPVKDSVIFKIGPERFVLS